MEYGLPDSTCAAVSQGTRMFASRRSGQPG